MKKLHTCLLAMLSVLALTWSACTDSCDTTRLRMWKVREFIFPRLPRHLSH